MVKVKTHKLDLSDSQDTANLYYHSEKDTYKQLLQGSAINKRKPANKIETEIKKKKEINRAIVVLRLQQPKEQSGQIIGLFSFSLFNTRLA